MGGGKKPAEKPNATRKAKRLFKMSEAASPAAKVLGHIGVIVEEIAHNVYFWY